MKTNHQHLSQDIFNKAHISSFSLKREAWAAQGQQSRAVSDVLLTSAPGPPGSPSCVLPARPPEDLGFMTLI